MPEAIKSDKPIAAAKKTVTISIASTGTRWRIKPKININAIRSHILGKEKIAQIVSITTPPSKLRQSMDILS